MTIAPDTLGPTICIGEILAEIVAVTHGAGFGEPIPLIGPYPSGAPAIFIDQCARMGGSAAIIGAVGDDDFGRLNLDRLSQDGVDISGVIVDPDWPTGTAFVRYRPDGNRDFVFNMWTSAAGRLKWTDEIEKLVCHAGHLHVMGTLLGNDTVWPLIERAAAIIKARGGTVSLDPNMRKELRGETGARVTAMVDLSDLLLPSSDELSVAAGPPSGRDEQETIASLFTRGVSEIVIKRGSLGSSCFNADGTAINAPGFVVDELDPTGAGDCFGGAYVAARRLGMPAGKALIYANAAGARNVVVRGPMEGASSRAQLETFMAKSERRS